MIHYLLCLALSAEAVEYINYPPPHIVHSGYDNKQSDGEVPVELDLWGMQSTPSLLLFLGPLWPGVVAPDRFLELFDI